MANKVKYGLRNVYYAVGTDNGAGGLTYDTPVKWPGAVSLTFSPEGGETKFYADDGVYFAIYDNNGYSGSIEVAQIPDRFREEVLNEIMDENGVLVEEEYHEPKKFALMFEFSGDASQTRHVMYGCVASRPDVASNTRGESTEVQTETLNLDAGPVAFGDEYYVKAKTTDSVDPEIYASWFYAVYTPGDASPTPIPGTALVWFYDWDEDPVKEYTVTFGVNNGYPVMVLTETT